MELFNGICVRTSLYTLDDEFKNFKERVQEKNFKEALLAASPVLYKRIYKDGKMGGKPASSLLKYYIRSMSRPTPFGLFGSVSFAEWSSKAENPNRQSTIIQNNKHVRLDMSILCEIVDKLESDPNVRMCLKYSLNSTVYRFNSYLRYIDYEKYGLTKKYTLEKIENDIYLEKLISFISGERKPYSEITKIYLEEGFNEEEIQSYLNNLIESHILVSELHPDLIGRNPFKDIIDILDTINGKIKIYDTLKELKSIIDNLNNGALTLTLDLHEQIIGIIKAILPDVKITTPLQIDSYIKFFDTDYRLSSRLKNKLSKDVELLVRLKVLSGIRNPLKNFIKKFVDRYELTEVKLIEALDPENGIPFEINNSLTEINTYDEKLFSILCEAFKNKHYEVKLEDHLPSLNITGKEPIEQYLPPTSSIMFKIVEIDGEERIFHKMAGGNSALSIIGRFCFGNKELFNLAKSIASYEQSLIGDDLILADVIHLPQSRTGNINSHPQFREYTIPYHAAKANSDSVIAIEIDDLYIKYCPQYENLILYSKRLDKAILPRLSHSHNYNLSDLPIYKFLAYYQSTSKIENMGFSWGKLAARSKFLPRVSYKGSVLHRSTWKFNGEELYNRIDKANIIKSFKLAIDFDNLPEKFLLIEGDNELLINSSNEESLKVFLHEIKNKPSINVQEFISSKNSQLTANSEFVSFTKNQSFHPIHSANFGKVTGLDRISRRFLIGSEWLYYKIYISANSAEESLVNQTLTFVNNLYNSGLANKIFFIRYYDPEFHIRLRVKLNETTSFFRVVCLFNEHFAELINNKVITSLSICEYQREIERYGNDNMDLSESYFSLDTLRTLKTLAAIRTITENYTVALIDYSIFKINKLFSLFGFTLNERVNLSNKICQGFNKEFSVSKNEILTINKNFREEKHKYLSIIDGSRDDLSFKCCLNIDRSFEADELILIKSIMNTETFNENPEGILVSYIHMMINRLFSNQQRRTEMICYNVLSRIYNFMQGRIKHVGNQKDNDLHIFQ